LVRLGYRATSTHYENILVYFCKICNQVYHSKKLKVESLEIIDKSHEQYKLDIEKELEKLKSE
jgi:hypothetical protein